MSKKHVRYHINDDNKILPCSAIIKACPYGPSRHASTKEALYWQVINAEGGSVSSPSFNSELRRMGRVKNLYRLSQEIADSSSPAQVISFNVGTAIKKLEEDSAGLRKYAKIAYDENVERVTENVAVAMNLGYAAPDFIPGWIAAEARDRANTPNRYHHPKRPLDSDDKFRKRMLDNARSSDQREDVREIIEYEKFGLNDDNYQPTMAWLRAEFQKHNHLVNVSKLITQPVITGNQADLDNYIKELNDEELLSSFEDYGISKSFIEDELRAVDFYRFTPRNDLTNEANKSLATWYEMNRKIYSSWEQNSLKRAYLHINMGEELDRRNLPRPDGTSIVEYNT